jgi:hypothetical protein
LLSIVLTGRNDDHGSDFRARFFRTIRFNAHQLTVRDIAHEFVFVEWAPLSDRPRLFDLILEAIPELDRRTLRWIVVDPRYQSALSQNPRLPYLEFLAKNVGLRRASGELVLTTNCDVILSRHVLDVLERGAVSPRTVYRARRDDLKTELATADIEWPLLEDQASLEYITNPLKPPLFAGAAGDFLLLDRQSYHDIRGFNEVYRVAKIAIDRNFLVKALSAGLQIVDIGGPVYHFNHAGTYRSVRDRYAGREDEAPWGNRRWHAGGVVYENPDSWGLRDAPAHQDADGCMVIDFSWDAVPPLVDLRRIVLPVARRGGPTPGRYVAQS